MEKLQLFLKKYLKMKYLVWKANYFNSERLPGTLWELYFRCLSLPFSSRGQAPYSDHISHDAAWSSLLVRRVVHHGSFMAAVYNGDLNQAGDPGS